MSALAPIPAINVASPDERMAQEREICRKAGDIAGFIPSNCIFRMNPKISFDALFAKGQLAKEPISAGNGVYAFEGLGGYSTM
jgi:hypothetical protein